MSSLIEKEITQGAVLIGTPKAYQYDAALVEAAKATVQQGMTNIVEKTEEEKTELDGYIEEKKAEVSTLGQSYVESTSQKVIEANTILSAIRNEYGYPFTAATAADMTDTSKIYVYVGNETGYTNGNWYYHNGTAWVSGGVYNSTAFETDTTLTVSGAAADAKVVGDFFGNTIRSESVKKVVGVSLLDGYGESELQVMKCIKRISLSSVRTGTTDGEMPIIRICVCVNTESYPKRISAISDGGKTFALIYGDSDIAKATNVENNEEITLEIAFDWDNYSGSYNTVYANSKMEISGTTYGALIQKNTEKNTIISKEVDNLIGVGEEIEATTVLSRYLMYNGTITAYQNHDNFFINVYPVQKGETVIAKGDGVKLSSNYALIGFADNYEVGTKTKIIEYATTDATDYKLSYTASEDGYIIIASRAESDYGKLKLYRPIDEQGFLQITKGAIFEEPMSASDSYPSTYINSNNIIIEGPSSFTLKKYKVAAGKVYRFVGERVRLNYSYPLASFSLAEFTGTKPFACNTEIISVDTGTAKFYNVEFIPYADGYIYVSTYSNYPQLSVYQGTQERIDSSLINTLTNTKKDFPIKMQLFGDSIMDDSWRPVDGTWATVFNQCFPQRVWDISNDAVGGSHMGHGHVNSETGKYHELEYNYVYDLITNENIFKPNSDIIVVFAGTNDFNSSPLGQYGDTTLNTFYGALYNNCVYLSENTSAKVFFVTPIARPADADSDKGTNENGEKINRYGATLRDYADAIKRVCSFYQFPVIDLFYGIGWNATNVRPFLDTSGIHPSAKGSMVISQLIAGKIKQHYAM